MSADFNEIIRRTFAQVQHAQQQVSHSAQAALMPSAPSGSSGSDPSIQVRPEELMRTSGICYSVASNLNTHLQDVHAIMTQFFDSDVFEGEQAQAVRESYSSTRENLDRFPQMVTWLGTQLEEAAYRFTEADKDNVTLYTESVLASTVLPLLPEHLQQGFFQRLAIDPEFAREVDAWAADAENMAAENAEMVAGAVKAIIALRTLYNISQGTQTVFKGGNLVTSGGKAATKFAKGMAAAGAAVTMGVAIYDAFTGEDQSPEMYAAQISSGLVQAAMGFTVVGAAVLAANAIVQFAGPIVADVMRDNADWLAGGGINADDIRSAADNFDQAVQDSSIDARMDGAFKALYSGDIGGVVDEMRTFSDGVVGVADNGAMLAGYAAGGLVNKLIPGAGGPVASVVSLGLMWGVQSAIMPFRAFNFAYDLFSGDATLGDLATGPANFIGNQLDLIGLNGAGDWVRDVGGVIGGGIDSAVNTVVDTAKDAWEAVKSAAEDVGDAIADGAEAVGDAFVDAGNAIGDFFSDPC